MLAEYTRKRDLFLGYLRETGLPFTTPQGAYYTLVDISRAGFATDRAAAEEMTKRLGVTGVPGSSFFREPEHRYIRFHFAKKDETLHRARERLAANSADSRNRRRERLAQNALSPPAFLLRSGRCTLRF